MTYHSQLPPHVMTRWQELNPEYTIDFSTDAECISFLEKAFHRNIAELFKYIPRGMYKADLWRLCKLYIHGGVYADIDLVPFRSIDDSVQSIGDGDGVSPTFYSCLSLSSPSVFQAYMKHTRERSPLLLGFLVSFLVNKPYTNIDNGPTSDMYHFILYNVRHAAAAARESGVSKTTHTDTDTQTRVDALQSFTRYTLRQIRIPIYVTSFDEDIIPLHYFPPDVKYHISISTDTRNEWVLANQDAYKMTIQDHCLIVERPECDGAGDGGDEGFIIDICIDLPEDQPEVLYLFQECIRDPPRISTCYIADCVGNNIMDCRDPKYLRDHGWIQR